MRLPTTLRWIGLALLGLVIAAVVALAASRLASQQIGIASESVSAGDSLAPPLTSAGTGRAENKGTKPEGKKGDGAGAETVGPIEPTGGAEPTEPTETPEAIEPAESGETETSAPEPSPEDDGGGGDSAGGGGGGGGPDD